MNAYEFGLLFGTNEKTAINWARAGARFGGVIDDVSKGFGKATAKLRQSGGQVLRQQAVDAAKLPKAPPGWLSRTAYGAGDEALTSLDNLGKFTRRQGRNAATAVKNWMNPPTSTPAVPRLTYNNPNSRALIPYKAPESRALIPYTGQMIQHPGRTWKDIGTGTGALLGGAAGLTAINPFRGGEPSAANIDAQQTNTQLAQGQHMEAAPNSGGLMGMWNSLPIEARYAIGAGVPLALAGAFMGGRGNTGLGGTMGALGLGAAGLGAAGAGMFGDGPRRLVGQGANALYGLAGGGNGNVMDQINALSGLSPEFGTTVLMGRDPNMSSGQARQMYDFLTHNRNIIEQLMPQLQGASVNSVKQSSAINFGEKIGRCWKGYEPVPGKKPYSNDSCRPVGSKKKKKEKKAVSSAARGKTEMNCTPSSRGTSKPIDDKQRDTNSPVPVGAGNAQQTNEKVSVAPFQNMDLVPEQKAKAKAQNKKKLPPVDLKPEGAQEKEAMPGAAIGRMIGGLSRGVSRNAGRAAGAVGNLAAGAGNRLATGSMQMAQKGLQQGGVRGAVNTALGAAGTAVGGGLNVAGRAAQGAGQVAQWAGKQVPGSRMMNAARTAVAMPIAGGLAYGAYQGTKPVTQPYTNAAYEFGANVAQTAGRQAQQAGQAIAAVPQAIGRGFHDAGSAMGDAVGTAYGNTRNAVVNTARDVRRGVNNAVQTAAAVPQAIGQGFHNAGTALGDAAGTAYGTARNAVVNTANDVRRGVNNAAQTARSYVPNVRNPFYYDAPPANVAMNPNAQAMLQ